MSAPASSARRPAATSCGYKYRSATTARSSTIADWKKKKGLPAEAPKAEERRVDG
jgi:hypothetical protein